MGFYIINYFSPVSKAVISQFMFVPDKHFWNTCDLEDCVGACWRAMFYQLRRMHKNLLGRESNKFRREWTTHDNLYMNIPKNNSHITCKMAIELLDFDSEWVRAKPFSTKNE